MEKDSPTFSLAYFSRGEVSPDVGRQLVQEYVRATAREMEVTVETLLPVIPDFTHFPADFADPGDFLVAHLPNQEVAGCVGIRPDGPGGVCEMNRLWVRPQARGMGLAPVLIEASLERARQLGYQRMILDVLPTRRRAIAIYEKHGFLVGQPFHQYDFEMVGMHRDTKI